MPIFNESENRPVGITVESTVDFTASAQTIEIKKCPNGEVVLAETAAVLINDSNSKKTINYQLDSVGYEPGKYLLIYRFTRDGIDRRVFTDHLEIKSLKC